ncbi:hypothetical protein J437_LFUL015332 [Ladona fulva]|uniref:C-CAP/cofactor C-like domain-containing protein n=1 Tax=Ladona fulva TaxID=123851 RepID=A0A8K0KGQ7_LADFU|nr:hypothetical protein J437_LFUL015332 [Ladona fulva]
MLCCGCGRKRTVSNEDNILATDEEKRCNGDGEDVADSGHISESKEKVDSTDNKTTTKVECNIEGREGAVAKIESDVSTGKNDSDAAVESQVNDSSRREEPPGEAKTFIREDLATLRNRFFADLKSGTLSESSPLHQIRPDPIGQEIVQLSDMASVSSFEAILQGPFATYLQCSSKIGGDVAAHAKLVEVAFNSSPTPAPYVKEMNDAGQFYTNRVLKEWKEKDKTHVEWTKAWIQTLSELQQYVKQHHTTGLCWGGRGVPEGGMPAPPPPPPGPMPPPPPPMDSFDGVGVGDVQDRSALFAEINQGEAITRSLKKVTPDMQTHKNKTLRSGPAPFKAPANDSSMKGFASVKGPGGATDKPPKFIREGKKWLVEHQKNNTALVVDNAEMNNVVYMYKCEGSTLTVRGKINSVVVDSCRKSSVVFDSLVSSVEFINCQSVQMQVLGKVPTITIDKTDGCQMYLSKESLDVEIVSSKSSEMNVMVPLPNGDYTEHPIPEQYKTTIGPKGLKTEVIECKA